MRLCSTQRQSWHVVFCQFVFPTFFLVNFFHLYFYLFQLLFYVLLFSFSFLFVPTTYLSSSFSFSFFFLLLFSKFIIFFHRDLQTKVTVDKLPKLSSIDIVPSSNQRIRPQFCQIFPVIILWIKWEQIAWQISLLSFN